MCTSDVKLDAATIDVAPPDVVTVDPDGTLTVSGDSDKQIAADPAPATTDLVG